MPDPTALEALVRATRPVPDPAWAARLDSRVAHGFPDAPPPWYLWPFALLRSNLVPAGALASVLAIVAAAALLANGGSDQSADSGGSVSNNLSGSEKSAGGDSAGSQAATPAAAPNEITSGGRATRRSAELTLSTRPGDVERVSDGAIRVADRLGGFVQSSSVSSGGFEPGASLVLRVPSARLPQALTQLSGLAHVKRRSQEAEDVTDQRSALRNDVTDARAERDGLRRRLARAETDTERARLRGQLQRAEQLIVTRKRRLARLDRAVSYASVGVEVQGNRRRGAAAPPPGGRWTPGDALRDAARVLEVSAGVAVIALAVLVPLGLIAALAAVAGRLVVRRRRERALEPA